MHRMNGLLLALTFILPGCMREPTAADVPQPTGLARPNVGPDRNLVNTIDKNLPTTWSVEEGKQKNIKWVAELGNHTYGGPAVADGIVYVGTNNARPRDSKLKGRDKAILMAFKESDGKFLWQIVHEFPNDEVFKDGREQGLCSTPFVEGKRIYYVAPTCELVCATTEGKVEWTYDMMKELKVVPYHLGNCSPLIVGDLLMVVTGNGRNDAGDLPSPKAPSFIAVNKKTGKLVWKSNLPGDRIVEGQWSNPTLANVNGKPQVIFPGGDCVLYSFEPQTGDLIWKCDCNPTRTKEGRNNYFMATPVVVGDRLYVGLGVAPENGTPPKSSYFVCLDITKKGDVSFKSYDAKNAVNKDSALVWAFGGLTDKRKALFGITISTAAVHDGLVYVPEETGYMHCFDAKTGERYWVHDFKTGTWASPYYVDGKVYVPLDDGDVAIFAAGKKMNLLARISMDERIDTTPFVANGVLFIATRSKLYAIANGK